MAEQFDLFGGGGEVLCGTTAIYPNRIADKAKVERLLGLPEHPAGVVFELFTPKGTLFARTYERIVYGDHGPYIELLPSQVLCGLKPKFQGQTLPAEAYYEWLIPTDGSGVKVYSQKRDVAHLKNAPRGGVRGNRAEGYADYRPGMIYVSPWELTVRGVPTVVQPSHRASCLQ